MSDSQSEDHDEEVEDELEGDSEDITSKFTCGSLLNVGNTCFLNAGVQVLGNCDSFAVSISEQPGEMYTRRFRKFQNPGRQKLMARWRGLLKSLHQANGLCVDPRNFVREVISVNSQFAGYGQQDSHEFIDTLLGAIDDETRDPFHLPAVLDSLISKSLPTNAHALRELSLFKFLDDLYNKNIRLDQLSQDRISKRKGKLTFGSGGAYYPRVCI